MLPSRGCTAFDTLGLVARKAFAELCRSCNTVLYDPNDPFWKPVDQSVMLPDTYRCAHLAQSVARDDSHTARPDCVDRTSHATTDAWWGTPRFQQSHHMETLTSSHHLQVSCLYCLEHDMATTAFHIATSATR